jgi:FkbM family methyltransferase
MGRKRTQTDSEEELRVTGSQETGLGGRADADGAPQLKLDVVQQRNETIEALRQRVDALTTAVGREADGGAGFNAAYADDVRVARTFAFQLNRLGVTRLLDIGAGAGRFGHQMRRFGYHGAMYAVEPRADRYTPLLASASKDPHWIPLARKGAGAASGSVDLPIAAASVAESGPPTEVVHVAKASDLWSPRATMRPDAVRINVAGMEAKILEGLSPLLDGVRALMLHCSGGGEQDGNVFALDAALVGSLGFTRATLEPARYDDETGVATRYHGVYVKPDRAPPRRPSELAGVVTSIGGSMTRLRADGTDVGPWWAGQCLRSWSALGGLVASVSESPPDSPAVVWSQCGAKPSIAEMFRRIEILAAGRHVILTNADIYLTDKLKAALPSLYPEVVYYGHRFEVRHQAERPGVLETTGYYAGGFDYFILPASFVRTLNENSLIPEVFLVGEAWWDYLVPLLAVATGFPCKKMPVTTAIYAMHYSHNAGRENIDAYLRNGQAFMDYIQTLHEGELPYARDVLAELLKNHSPEYKERLWHVAEHICYLLP